MREKERERGRIIRKQFIFPSNNITYDLWKQRSNLRKRNQFQMTANIDAKDFDGFGETSMCEMRNSMPKFLHTLSYFLRFQRTIRLKKHPRALRCQLKCSTSTSNSHVFLLPRCYVRRSGYVGANRLSPIA